MVPISALTLDVNEFKKTKGSKFYYSALQLTCYIYVLACWQVVLSSGEGIVIYAHGTVNMGASTPKQVIHITCCSMTACCCWRRAWSCWGDRTCCWRICCICWGVITWGVIMATDTGTLTETEGERVDVTKSLLTYFIAIWHPYQIL